MKITSTIILSLIAIITFSLLTNTKPQSPALSEQSKELKEITVRLPIPIYDSAFTPFFSALDNGYYAEYGLDVKFDLGSPELNPVKMVASGADTFGVLGGPDSLLIARSKGIPIKALSIMHHNSNFPGLITLANSGITKIEQLDGKKVGFFYGHISTDVIRNMLRKENINVEEVAIGFNYGPLITGDVDAAWAFRSTAAVNLPNQGVDIHFISPAEYGINTHGYTIFSHENTINSEPELVKNFLDATLQGIEFTLENPDTALKSLLARDSQLNPILERQRLDLYLEVMESESHPIGYIDGDMLSETLSRLEEEGVIENSINYKDSYDGSFLNQIYKEYHYAKSN